MSLKKSLLKNGLASFLQKVVRLLEQLFLVPFFISAWGANYYGEWLTLTIIPSVLSFANLGFGSAAGNTFVLFFTSGKKKEAADVAKSGFWIITIMVTIALLISGLALLILNYFNVFEKLLIEKDDVLLAISFMMIASILKFYQQLYEGYYRAVRRASLGINMLSLYALLNVIVGFVVLVNKGNIVYFSFFNLITALLFYPLFILVAKKILKKDSDLVNNGKVKRQYIQEITKKGLGYLMSPVWQAIYFQGTTFVVRIVLGPGAVAIFNTVRTVTRSINQLFGLINGSIFPEIQFEAGRGNMEKVREIYRGAVGAVFVIAFFGCFCLLFFGQDLYAVWTNKSLNPPPLMWVVFSLGIMFNALWWTSGVVFNAFNQPYKYSTAGLICTIISVTSSYFLCIRFGLVGAATGAILLDLLLVVYVIPASCKLINQPLSSLIKDIYNQFYYYIIGFLGSKWKS